MPLGLAASLHPAKYDGLPGKPYPANPWAFPSKDEVADYLEAYALESDLPVRLQTSVDRLERGPSGQFTSHLGTEVITSDNVVVATGTRGRTPLVPAFARALAPSIRQLHSTEYRRHLRGERGRVCEPPGREACGPDGGSGSKQGNSRRRYSGTGTTSETQDRGRSTVTSLPRARTTPRLAMEMSALSASSSIRSVWLAGPSRFRTGPA